VQVGRPLSAKSGLSGDPLDLEIIDRVYEVASAHIEARNLYRETDNGVEEKEAPRKRVFGLSRQRPIDLDSFCDSLLASLPEQGINHL
jgi:hypothetical protein